MHRLLKKSQKETTILDAGTTGGCVHTVPSPEVTDIIAFANPDKEEERDALPKVLGKVLDRIRNLSFFPASMAVKEVMTLGGTDESLVG